MKQTENEHAKDPVAADGGLTSPALALTFLDLAERYWAEERQRSVTSRRVDAPAASRARC